MSSGMSPYPGNTPPPESAEERAARERQEELARQKKRLLIALVKQYLDLFPENYQLVRLLGTIITTHASLDKRYWIAVAINNIMAHLNIEDPQVQAG